MSGTSPQTGTTPSSGTQSGPLSGGAIPPASNTPCPTTTTLPTDRLDAIDQALSELHASQADHDKLWVKQASGASSLSDCINHFDQKLETFADVLSNDVKLARKSNDVALAALNDLISQLQNLLKAQLVDKGQKDDSLGSGSSSSSSSEEEEEKEKEKRKTLNLMARHQDFQQHMAKNLGDSLGDVQLTQSLLTTETLPTFHGKPNEDPNIFLTLFDHYATTAGRSHQDYILHFEGQLHDNADVVYCFLKQEQMKATAKIMTLGNLQMNVDESVDAWNLQVRTALQEAFLTDFSETQVLEKLVTGAVLDLKEKFLQQEDIANMADALNLMRDWEGQWHAKKSLDH